MKYVDSKYAGDAPVELIKYSVGIGRVRRECDGCGVVLNPGEWRKSVTGKYNDEITTKYFCKACADPWVTP